MASTPPRPRRDPTALALSLGFAFLIVLAVAATLFARGRWWLPPVASAQGVEIDRLFRVTFVILSIAFVLVHGLLALFVWRFRARGEERASYWHENRTLEAAYTIIPAIVMITLTVIAAGLWGRIHSPPPPDALVMEVRAEQFTWLARYPGRDGVFGRIDSKQYDRERNPMALERGDPAGRDDIVANELHLVVNRPVRLRLRSKDVIHSFYVPALRVKQDAVPGITVETWFTPTRLGRFQVVCAELCGVGHYVMVRPLVVESEQAFNVWLAAQRPKQP